MGGTIAFISGPELVSEVSDGKLAANMVAEVETLGILFVTDAGKISEASVAEGAGGKAEGKADGAGGNAEGARGKAEGAGAKLDGGNEADVTLGVVVLTGSKDDGNSGKLEDTVGKE